MPTTTSAAKRQRQNKTKRNRNRAILGKLRTTMRKFRDSVDQKTVTKEELATLTREIDRAVSKGVLKKNSAARKKSRLQKRAASILN